MVKVARNFYKKEHFTVDEDSWHMICGWCHQNGIDYQQESWSSSPFHGEAVMSIRDPNQRAWFIMKWL